MPRYFFNLLGRSTEPDSEGSEFPDIQAAQAAAVRLCGELIKELDGTFWAEPNWRLQVTSHDQKILLTFTFSALAHESDTSD